MDFGLKKIISGLVKDPTKIVGIIDAWVTAKNPTNEEKTLAEARWNVCLQCEEFREKRPVTGEPYCNECGCPLNKKIFSKVYNDCPFEKWKNVDDLLYTLTQKQDKSII